MAGDHRCELGQIGCLKVTSYGDVPPLEAYPKDQRERIRTQHEEMVLRPRLTPEGEASRA